MNRIESPRRLHPGLGRTSNTVFVDFNMRERTRIVGISGRPPLENLVNTGTEKLEIIEGPERYNPKRLIKEVKNLFKKDVLRTETKVKRSGCRCPDKENRETGGCRSRFCEKKRPKDLSKGNSRKPERETRRGILVSFPTGPKTRRISAKVA